MSVPIYIKSKVKKDDVFCNKSRELLDEVDKCISTLKTNPNGLYETIYLKRDDKFQMRVAFYGQHPDVYVYVSADDVYQADESRPFDVSKGCAELRNHVAQVLDHHQ